MSAAKNPLVVLTSVMGLLERMGCVEAAADLARAGAQVSALAAAGRLLLQHDHPADDRGAVGRMRTALEPFSIQCAITAARNPVPIPLPPVSPLAGETVHAQTPSKLHVRVDFDANGNACRVYKKAKTAHDFAIVWCVTSGRAKTPFVKAAIFAATYLGTVQ